MGDDHDTRLVTEPPAPQKGDIVEYHEFLEIILGVLEGRWLVGERPDISGLSGNSDLRSVLNQQVVDLARSAHDIGKAISEDNVESEALNALEAEIEEIEAVVSEIRNRHS